MGRRKMVSKPKARVPYGDKHWKDEFFLEAYKLSRSGHSDAEIAQTLGVGRSVFERWRRSKPTLQKALDEGRSLVQKKEEEVDRLYNRLPPELQDVWDRVMRCQVEPKDEDKDVIRSKRRLRIRIDQEINRLSLRMKQQLYLHALECTDYSASESSRLTGITPYRIKEWMQDKQFAQLLSYVQESKKDLYESALVQLVKQGEPQAVVFANKTLNRDRGYNDKTESTVNVNVAYSVDQLGLSLEDRKKLLEAVRAKQTMNLQDKQILEVEAK
jgi:hypothetical protein